MTTTATDLMDRVDDLRVSALRTLGPATQASLGQHFTPRPAAVLMSEMLRLRSLEHVRLLDPGAGSGILLAAVVRRLVCEGVRRIDATAIEVDPVVIPWLSQTADVCVAWAAAHGCELTVKIVQADFIVESTPEQYDVVVMNPPYAKLSTRSVHRKAMVAKGIDCPNLYSAFVALGVQVLAKNGRLVAITPRSFTNGPYFDAFRKCLLNSVSVDRIHVFESRSAVFAETKVLQENVVFSVVKGGVRNNVTLTVSSGYADSATEHSVKYDDLVHPDDPNQFIRLATSDDVGVAEVMAAMPSALADLNLNVSTGKVVDFRARGNLREMPDSQCAPLVYPANLRNGVVDWPRVIRKPQGYAVIEEADVKKALLPAGCYVLVKRFSAKEERRRIVAAVWDPMINGNVPVAVENHLNVFHNSGAGLNREVAWGLSLWLNSTLVDQYFRTFSGHTQVNATDLRTLRFPALAALQRIGGRLAGNSMPEQKQLDGLVASLIRTDPAR